MTNDPPPLANDPLLATELFARSDRELWLVTAQAGSRRGGLIATFVSHASLVPELPRVLIAVALQHHTWELIESSGAFGLHLIGEEQLDWVWQFGLQSGRDTDKLAGLTFETAVTGSPLLSTALGWLDCRVEARLDTGDRTAYLAQVVAARTIRDAPPLTFQRLLQLAPEERRNELRAARQRDAAIDAAAIRAWPELRVEG
ncbi:MAG TPA: flavin reductase family protein [Pirellulales bacterium]|nr:flavin reductase family protein [Pirellulales bacterium]